MRLKKIRLNAGLKQKDIAEKLNCSIPVYSRYETEKRNMDYNTLIKLSKILGVSIDYILENDNYALETKKNKITYDSLDIDILKQYHKADTFDQIAILRILEKEKKLEVKYSKRCINSIYKKLAENQ
ncbi:XRE family transcriptional regulator [bacterium D16-51]|nr:XRE family transcriptional regulator [bacterium D16-51]